MQRKKRNCALVFRELHRELLLFVHQLSFLQYVLWILQAQLHGCNGNNTVNYI